MIEIVSGSCGIELVRRRPLRRYDFDRLRVGGLFDDEPVELLAGALVEVGEGPEHDAVVARLAARLRGLGRVQVQTPLTVDDYSVPRPDLALYRNGIATGTPSLIIEVAAGSRDKDRTLKAELYARAGVAEYWLVDLIDRRVERRTGSDPGLGLWQGREIVTGGAPAILASDPRVRLAFSHVEAPRPVSAVAVAG